MSKTVIVGYGYWGKNLARNFVEELGASSVVVCDLDPAKVEAAVRRFPGITGSTRPEEAVVAPDVVAVVIATPVRTHYDLALAALLADKHVWVEKPVTQTSAQAERLLAEAKARNRVLLVDHTYLYTAAVQKIRDFIVAGELGDVLYYDSIRVNLGLFQHEVDVIWDLAVHDIAILDYVLGQHPSAVSANGMSHVAGSPENVAYMTLFFDSNTIAHINVNWLAPVKIRKTLIGGSRKMIVFDDLEPSEKIKIYDKGVDITDNPDKIEDMRISYRIGDMYAPNLQESEALRVEVRHFMDCVRTGARPLTDGAMGLRIVRILEAASRSMEQRGAPVSIVKDEP